MKREKYLLYITWIAALSGTVGSLIFSEILHFVPCTLCWYQRIFMYPIAILLPIAILRKDKHTSVYILPLSVIGGLIAMYHELLQIGIIPEAVAPCSAGISCTTKYINLFGFLSIPLLSLLTFAIITLCMLLFQRRKNEK
ncbi:MAG: disulfide bond formation protein B [Candidatus Levybacteria bacterium]|nr:disulfide bond formation protein B [Candidatus Levybacteria bacterium]